MKTIIFIAIIAFAVTDCYDLERIDIDELISNTNEFKRFVDCFLDRGQCSELYSKYKAVTPDAVETACSKCSPYQKHSFWLFLKELISNYPNDYFNFKDKYDPENKYFEALKPELKKYSISY